MFRTQARYEHQNGGSEIRNWKRLERMSPERALGALLEDDMMKNHLWNKLWRSGLFAGIRFQKERRYEDIAITYRLLARAEKIICLLEPKYHYLRYPGSLMGDKSLSTEIDYFLVVKERFEALAPAWPQYADFMEEQAVSAAVKLWNIYFDNPRSERLANKERLRCVSRFTKAHGRRALRHMGFGLAGRILVRLTAYAGGWSFALARGLDKLYQIKIGLTGKKELGQILQMCI